MAPITLGYTLSCEEFGPIDLIKNAVQAEQAGFAFLSISDHIFPWIDSQGHAPFVWSVLGALSQATTSIPIMTGVTCPIIRIHPVIIAQAAATAAVLLPGRFSLGLGTGENLNEHVVGQGWPNINRRQQMLAEAIDLIRQLWQGQVVDHQGAYFTADQARIYTLPDQLPPILIAASGPDSASLAGQHGDGLISTGPDPEVITAFDQHGGQGKPKYGQVSVCYHPDLDQAKQIALKAWPTAGISGQASQELPMPSHFAQLASSVTADDIATVIACGPDPQVHLQKIKAYQEAGFTHVYVHQVGPNQAEFFDFYQQHILPSLNG